MIVVVSGPSGVGKTTLVCGLMERQSALTFSISHTTRAPRGRERDGVEYYFVDEQTFEALVLAGEFAEHARVHGHRYGTAKQTLAQAENEGKDTLLDIDYQGALQISATYPEAPTILIAPPSMAELESRLRGRGTDTQAQMSLRLAKARHELAQYRAFRYVVVNDDAARAIARLEAIYLSEGARTSRNESFMISLVGRDI